MYVVAVASRKEIVMQDKKSKSAKQVQAASTEMVEEGYAILPFNEGQFRDFIKSLLGSPQSISKSFEGAFQSRI